MGTVYSVAELIGLVKSLQPASSITSTGIKEVLCTTPLITEVMVDGKSVELFPIKGKYAAGYVRVSTSYQRDDGYSIDDQLNRIIHHYINQRQAFRIYSDAGLSGGLPTNDPHLIEKMLEKKALRYASIFQNVFLSDTQLKKYTSHQIACMQAYLEEHVEHIRSSSPFQELDLPRPSRKSKVTYRPGLSILMQELPSIHTLAITELSRLSRNHALFGEIVDNLQRHNIKVVGLTESLSFMNSDEIGDRIVTQVLTLMSEHRLREVCLNSLRGIRAALEAGVANGQLPYFLVKAKDGKAVFKPGVEKAILRMVDLFLNHDVGVCTLYKRLNAEGYSCPSRTGRFTLSIVKGTLQSPALYGVQRQFGLDFPVCPALISEETFQRIQIKLGMGDRSIYDYTYRRKYEDGYLATGLLKCVCGRALCFRRDRTTGKYHHYICGEAVRSGKQGREKHVSFNVATIDQFLNDLIQYDAAVLLSQFKNDHEYQKLQEELKHQETILVELQAQAVANEACVRQEAAAKVEAAGIEANHPMYATVLDTFIKAVSHDTMHQQERIEQQIQHLKQALVSFVPQERITAIAERVQVWSSLTNLEKNAVLRSMFDRFVYREVSRSEQYLVLILHGNRELPPIRLKLIDKGRAITRRLPTASEWIDTVISEQSSRAARQS